MPRELVFPGENAEGAPDLGEQLAEEIASTPTPQLVELKNSITRKLAEGAIYSHEELAQVRDELGGMFNTQSPELARNTLFINDVLQIQLITQELQKRDQAG